MGMSGSWRRYCQELWTTGAEAWPTLGAEKTRTSSIEEYATWNRLPSPTARFDNGFLRSAGAGRAGRDSPPERAADAGGGLENLVPWLWLKRISTGEFPEALQNGLGTPVRPVRRTELLVVDAKSGSLRYKRRRISHQGRDGLGTRRPDAFATNTARPAASAMPVLDPSRRRTAVRTRPWPPANNSPAFGPTTAGFVGQARSRAFAPALWAGDAGPPPTLGASARATESPIHGLCRRYREGLWLLRGPNR